MIKNTTNSYKKLNQKGFAVLELAIVVVILAAIGGGGYYVWHKNHTKKATTTTSTSSSSKSSSGSSSTSSSTTATITTTTLGNTSTGLQTAVSNKLKSSDCLLSNGNVASGVGDTTGTSLANLQVYYLANSAAKIKTCGSISYYSDRNDVWSYDVGGQDALSCSTYLKYEIPASLVAAGTDSSTAQCVNSSGTGLDTYTSN